MDANRVIAANHPWSGEFDTSSFRACLYEDAKWSQDEYWKVEWALFQLVDAARSDAELRSRVFRLFSATFALFAAHANPNDFYVIQNFDQGPDDDTFQEAMERFQLVFEGFFAGEMPGIDLLLESYAERNPLLSPGA